MLFVFPIISCTKDRLKIPMASWEPHHDQVTEASLQRCVPGCSWGISIGNCVFYPPRFCVGRRQLVECIVNADLHLSRWAKMLPEKKQLKIPIINSSLRLWPISCRASDSIILSGHWTAFQVWPSHTKPVILQPQVVSSSCPLTK